MNERHSHTVLPNRVNEEAVVYRGCTTTELTAIAAIAQLFWLVVTAVIGSMLGYVMAAIAFSMLLTVLTVFVAATLFQRIKRGQAPGHYRHVVAMALGRRRWRRSPFVVLDGPLSIGRSRQVVLATRHLGVETLEDDEGGAPR